MASTAGKLNEYQRFIQSGTDYRIFIARLAKYLECNSYFEIGVNKGRSIRDIEAASIGVDPEFRINFEIVGKKPMLQLYQMTSDDFFAKYRLSALFGGPVDLAFLDGMHKFEFLLRDFINTEPETHDNSVILLHDCFPINAEMTERERSPRTRKDFEYRQHWTGDVWKLIPILRKYRPDICIRCLNCAPTGLAMITQLDPKSTILRDKHDQIVEEFMNVGLTDETIHDHFAANPFVEPESALNSP